MERGVRCGDAHEKKKDPKKTPKKPKKMQKIDRSAESVGASKMVSGGCDERLGGEKNSKGADHIVQLNPEVKAELLEFFLS